MQNSLAKKLFAVGVAGATVLMSFAPLAAHAAVHAAGTNVLSSDGTVSIPVTLVVNVNTAPTVPTLALKSSKNNTTYFSDADLKGSSVDEDGDAVSVSEVRYGSSTGQQIMKDANGLYPFTSAPGSTSTPLYIKLSDGKTSIDVLTSVAVVNDGPTGSPTYSFPSISEGTAVYFTDDNLLQGFSDPNKDALSVTALNANNGTIQIVDHIPAVIPVTDYQCKLDAAFNPNTMSAGCPPLPYCGDYTCNKY